METKFTEEEIRNYYKHMSEAGYDPLLCVRKTARFVDFSKPGEFFERESIKFIDRIITEDRFVDLIKNGEVDKFDDIMTIKWDTVVNLAPFETSAQVKLFWLYPSGCRCLNDLFEKYKAKIRIVMVGP
jgi:hypothetical protein